MSGAAVDVHRRADLPRNVGEVDAVAGQHAMAAEKTSHRTGHCTSGVAARGLSDVEGFAMIRDVPRRIPIPMSSDPPVASAPSTDELIERCLAGDQVAWEQIVRQHWRKVFNLAYKFVGRHDEAEDLTQDIFLKIFKALAHVRSTRQLPDLADQHQPQPLHRSLPQRPQGTRDDGARRRRVGADAGLARSADRTASSS